MKRKEPDSGKGGGTTAIKRNRGTAKTSEGPAAKQISPSPVVTVSSADPVATSSEPHRSTTAPRTMASSPDIFPRFSAGTVLIQLTNEPKDNYQLHRAVLDRNSTWFAHELKKNEGQRESVSFCFVLRRPPGQVIPVLYKMVIAISSSKSGNILTAFQNPSLDNGRSAGTGSGGSARSSTNPEFPPLQPPSQRVPLDRCSSTVTVVDLPSSEEPQSDTLSELNAGATAEMGNQSETKVKEEPIDNPSLLKNATTAPNGSLDASAMAKEHKTYEQYVEAYNSLLCMFYNIAPKVSTSDISCALRQCERIVELAMIYGSLPTIRPYLGNVLAQFRQKLYVSIAQDPPRWLLLGVALESGSIFCEAMIHCAGSYPSCPWKTRYSTLPANVLSIIEKKSRWLARLRSEVNQDLFVNTICEANDGPAASIKTSPEAWIVVQIFRDWLGLEIQNQRESSTVHYGTFYRMMARGGNAYLPATEVSNLLEDADLGGKLIDENWEDVEGDLKMIKAFARKVVGQLVENNLLVDPAALGIPYLTCVEVGESDYPWMKQGDVKSAERAGWSLTLPSDLVCR